jgi:DNA polymerase-4
MIACLTIPYFAATVERRDDRDLTRLPLIIGGQPLEPMPLFSFSADVARQGVRPGMSLRSAYLLSPGAHFMAPATPRYAGAAGEVVDVLADFTPLIEPQNSWDGQARVQFTASEQTLPARYYLDLEALPLREAFPLSQEVGRMVRSQTTLPPAVGLAPHKFTARVAAALARPHHALPVRQEEEVAFLAPRSLNFLPLDRDVRRRLHLLGIHTLGQFAGMPPAALREQFGSEILFWQRLALGQDERPVTPEAPPRQADATHRFEDPVADERQLAGALDHLTERLARYLAETDQVAQALHIRWQTADGRHPAETRPLRELTASAPALRLALSPCLRAAPRQQGIFGVTVSLMDLTPGTAQQLSLFATPPAPLPALARLIARHGVGVFWRASLPQPDHPLPEQRFELTPLQPPTPAS